MSPFTAQMSVTGEILLILLEVCSNQWNLTQKISKES